MSVKVDASVLGIKKPVELKESNRNIKATLKLQVLLNKLSKLNEDTTYEEYLDMSIKIQEETQDYIVNMLKLSDQQQEKLEDLEQEETGALITSIVEKILHLDEAVKEEDDPEASKQ